MDPSYGGPNNNTSVPLWAHLVLDWLSSGTPGATKGGHGG
jgi:hypothetical protein